MKINKQEKRFKVLRCLNCGLSRTWPIPAIDSFLEDLSLRIENINLWQKFGQRPLAIIRKYKKKGELLDVGCNIGVFVNLAKEQGYEAVGIDLAEEPIKKGRELFNLKEHLFVGSLKEMAYSNENFDIITYLHVLEHILNLEEELREIWRVLKKNGILLIETPNFNSLWRKILRDKWYALSLFALQNHVWQFEPQSLKMLLEKNNFKDLKIITKYNMYHKKEFNFRGLIKILISLSASLIKRGDNLFIVAQKC